MYESCCIPHFLLKKSLISFAELISASEFNSSIKSFLGSASSFTFSFAGISMKIFFSELSVTKNLFPRVIS